MKSKKIYIVQRHGVYAQEILGVYDNQGEAEKRANEIAQNDKDDYHDYYVSEAPLNELISDTKNVCAFRKGNPVRRFEKRKPEKSIVFREVSLEHR